MQHNADARLGLQQDGGDQWRESVVLAAGGDDHGMDIVLRLTFAVPNVVVRGSSVLACLLVRLPGWRSCTFLYTAKPRHHTNFVAAAQQHQWRWTKAFSSCDRRGARPVAPNRALLAAAASFSAFRVRAASCPPWCRRSTPSFWSGQGMSGCCDAATFTHTRVHTHAHTMMMMMIATRAF